MAHANSGTPVAVCTISNANGWSALNTPRVSRPDVGAITMAVAAAASVPASSTVIVARCTAWSM